MSKYCKVKNCALIVACLLALNLSLARGNNFTDTTQKQKSNLTYDVIYKQNIAPGFFGNEYGNPIHDLLVADLNPNVVLFNSRNSRLFFLFSPRVKLRLLSAYHSPVKSPSYMPGGTLFFRFTDNSTKPKFLSVAYSHHSNGQEG